jgi:hypothetical protein
LVCLASVLGGVSLYHYLEYPSFGSAINLGKVIGQVIAISYATGNYCVSLCSNVSSNVDLKTAENYLTITRDSSGNTVLTPISSDVMTSKLVAIIIGRVL